jgi:hypothetical protein
VHCINALEDVQSVAALVIAVDSAKNELQQSDWALDDALLWWQRWTGCLHNFRKSLES